LGPISTCLDEQTIALRASLRQGLAAHREVAVGVVGAAVEHTPLFAATAFYQMAVFALGTLDPYFLDDGFGMAAFGKARARHEWPEPSSSYHEGLATFGTGLIRGLFYAHSWHLFGGLFQRLLEGLMEF